MRKKLLSVILAIAMLACMIPLGMVMVSAEEPHTHTPSDTYMTDGRAHWLKCDDENCPLNKADDPVLAYEIAFSSYEGPELKELLDYSETCHTNGADTTSMLMGRQGKYDGTVSKTDGRTIIGLTQGQLDNIGSQLVIVGSDDSDYNTQVSVDVDCAYTWFYDIVGGEAVKIEAANTTDLNGNPIAAFVIIDSNLAGTITGYGYYRVYNDFVSDGTLIGEALYKAPRTFKAVYDTTNDANTLNFYFDDIEHEGTVYIGTALFDEEKAPDQRWGYYDDREDVKSVNIAPNVIKYHDLKDANTMFCEMRNATGISGAEYLDVTNVSDFGNMFSKFAYYVTDFNQVPDVSRWNTEKAETISSIFSSYGYKSTTLAKTPDVTNWNVSAVTTANSAFYCYGNASNVLNFTLDLSKWTPKKMSSTSYFFYGLGSKPFNVTIPKQTEGYTSANTDTIFYTSTGGSSIAPASGKSFTLAN